MAIRNGTLRNDVLRGTDDDDQFFAGAGGAGGAHEGFVAIRVGIPRAASEIATAIPVGSCVIRSVAAGFRPGLRKT